MASLSYQEKSLYGELVVDLAVFVPYFVLMHTRHPSVNFIAGSITVLIVASIVLQGVIAAVTRNRLKDERDRLILLRGYRAAYFTITSLMVLGMAALWLHSSLGQVNAKSMALHFLSVFYAILILAQVVKTVTQLVGYRRAL
jgi:hydrogenase-4 membrane subunit HyfE